MPPRKKKDETVVQVLAETKPVKRQRTKPVAVVDVLDKGCEEQNQEQKEQQVEQPKVKRIRKKKLEVDNEATNVTTVQLEVAKLSIDEINENSSSPTTTQATKEKQIDTIIEPVTSVEKEMLNEGNSTISSLSLQRDVKVPSNVIKSDKERINPNEFYLYYDLERQVESTKTQNDKLSRIDQDRLLHNISKMDTEGMRLLFVLIRMHAVKNKQSRMFDLPYKGRVLKDYSNVLDIEFDLNDLPLTLHHMMLKFTQRHLEHLETSSIRMQPF